MTWNYAVLSKLAKASGGPEQLIDNVISEALKTGRSQMFPAVVGAALIGGTSVVVYQKLKVFFAAKNTQAEIKTAGEEIIQAINDYDNGQPEENIDIKEEKEEEKMNKIPYSELYDKARIIADNMTCLDCGKEGSLEYADDEVLVCRNCGFSIEAEDLFPDWLDKLIQEGDYFD